LSEEVTQVELEGKARCWKGQTQLFLSMSLINKKDPRQNKTKMCWNFENLIKVGVCYS